MGKQPKIYEKYNRPFKSDRKLVTEFQSSVEGSAEWKDAVYELWDKYLRVVSIGKRELLAVAKRNNINISEIAANYGGLFWEKFVNQLNGIHLNRVTHLPNWSMYIRVLGYLRSMNRDILKDQLKWLKNTKEIIESWEDGDVVISSIDKYASSKYESLQDQYDNDINRKIFWESMNQLKTSLSEVQKTMLNLKIRKKKIYEIQHLLNLSSMDYNNNMKTIKVKLNEIIKTTANKHGLENFDYNKLCIELQ